MNILFIGDIVGKSGRNIVATLLPKIKKEYNIDFTIANGENAAHGKGITEKIYHQLLGYGIDFITLGNHAFSKDDVYKIIDEPQIIRPMNMVPKGAGKGYRVVSCLDKKILIANISGEIFMNNITESPFDAMNRIQDVTADIKIVDFHGEATSEKIAFAFQFGQSLNAVIGTHTHVQTADERIIDGCAFITDVGMTGPFVSILGRDVSEVLHRMVSHEKTRYTVSDSAAMFCAVVISIDEQCHTTAIQRIQIRP